MPGELHETHALNDELDGGIDTMLSMERELSIEMFHGDEVNDGVRLMIRLLYHGMQE